MVYTEELLKLAAFFIYIYLENDHKIMITKFEDFKLFEDGEAAAAPASFSSVGGSVAVGTAGDAYATNTMNGMGGMKAAAPVPTNMMVSQANDAKYFGSGDIGCSIGSPAIKQAASTKKEKKVKKKGKNIKKFDDLFKITRVKD